MYLENTSEAKAEIQRPLYRGGIGKGLEKWPQRWQVMLACNPLCTTMK